MLVWMILLYFCYLWNQHLWEKLRISWYGIWPIAPTCECWHFSSACRHWNNPFVCCVAKIDYQGNPGSLVDRWPQRFVSTFDVFFRPQSDFTWKLIEFRRISWNGYLDSVSSRSAVCKHWLLGLVFVFFSEAGWITRDHQIYINYTRIAIQLYSPEDGERKRTYKSHQHEEEHDLHDLPRLHCGVSTVFAQGCV